VVVFNESGQQKETRSFKLGDIIINETIDYTHLDLVCDSRLIDRHTLDKA